MSKTNTKTVRARTVAPKHRLTVTHAGGTLAVVDSAERELRRSVVNCMLWEDQHYEAGTSIASRIQELAAKIEPEKVAALAVEARHSFGLRHVPLLLLVVLAKTGSGIPYLVAETVERVVSRPDEAGELVAIYWKVNGGKKPLPAQFKKGLAKAVVKFDQYQLTKWDRDADVKFRDVVFLTHPNPLHGEVKLARHPSDKRHLFAKLVNKERFPTKYNLHGQWEKLPPPYTWEVELSKLGADKRAVWEGLLSSGKLGYNALLQNLRNMVQANVDVRLIQAALAKVPTDGRVFPFKFLTAAKYAPTLAGDINDAFLASFKDMPKWPGKTVIIVDVSGSMYGSKIAAKSEMDRAQASCALAAVLREVCEHVSVYATAGSDGARKHKTELVPSHRGIPLAEYIHGRCNPLGGGGIFLSQVNDFVHEKEGGNVDRYICITDEQDTSGDSSALRARVLGTHNYIINVASYAPSVVYNPLVTKVEGFSFNLVRWISEVERSVNRQ